MSQSLHAPHIAHPIPLPLHDTLSRLRRDYRLGTLALLLAAVAAVAIVMPLASIAMRPAVAGPATEIRAIVATQVDAINSGDDAAMAETYCAALRPEIRAMLSARPLSTLRPAGERIAVQSVTDITVTGETATALVALSGSPTAGALATTPGGRLNAFVHENDGWKLCVLPGATTV